MSGRRNTRLPGARATSCGLPIVVELDSDSGDEDVEVSRYSAYPLRRNIARVARPPSTIDLASQVDDMDCEVGSVNRHSHLLNPLSPFPSTSSSDQTNPIPRVSTTTQTTKNHEDENVRKLENAQTKIRKMEEESKKLNEELSSLKQRAAETENVLAGKDEEIDQGRREICSLHQQLNKINTDLEEKTKEAEKLWTENSTLKQRIDKMDGFFKNENKEAEQMKMRQTFLERRLDKTDLQLKDKEKETKQLQRQLDETAFDLKENEKEAERLRKQNSSLQQLIENTNTAFKQKDKEVEQLKQEFVIYKADIESKLKERVKQQEKLDEVTKQLQDSTEELNSIKTKFEEEKVRCLDIQKSAKEEQRMLLARQEEMASEIKTKLQVMESRINKLQKLSSQTESDMKQKLSDIETKQQLLQVFFSKLKQKEEELEKDLKTKNVMLEKVVGEKAELGRRNAAYHGENERLTLQLKNLVEIKQKCEELQLLLNFPVEPTAAAGTSHEPELAVTCNDPSSTNHPENSMDNQNDAAETNTSLSEGRHSHGITTRLSTGSLRRRSATTLLRSGTDAQATKYTKAVKKGPECHLVDDSAEAVEYRCKCGKVLQTAKGLKSHVQHNGHGDHPFLCDKFDRGYITKNRLDYRGKTNQSDQSSSVSPNVDVRVSAKRKRNHVLDDDDDVIPQIDYNGP